MSMMPEVDGEMRRLEQYYLAVFKTAVEATIEDMRRPVAAGGNMPVDVGFLRNSLEISTTAMPLATRQAPESGSVPLPVDVGPALAAVRPGDVVHAGFTAVYAARVNYGFVGTDRLGRNYNQAGRHFVELAEQRWPENLERAKQQGMWRAGR